MQFDSRSDRLLCIVQTIFLTEWSEAAGCNPVSRHPGETQLYPMPLSPSPETPTAPRQPAKSTGRQRASAGLAAVVLGCFAGALALGFVSEVSCLKVLHGFKV